MQTGGVFTVQIALPHFRYNSDQKVWSFFCRPKRAAAASRECALSQSATRCPLAAGRAEADGQD